MKKITSILLALVLVLSICGTAMLTVGAEEETSDTWDGTASIKWYLDGANADGVYELKTAEDLAGLAFLVGAAQAEGRYTGVYHSADGTVAGYKAGSNDTAQQDSSLVATSGDGCVNGDHFLGKTVVLTVDVVLNEGDAEDWATTAPVNNWQPIGGNIINDGYKRAAFDGEFDGQGHTVSGLYYKSTTDFGGLFGATGQQFPATIKNLKLTNCYVNGKEECGILVGRSGKGLTIDNVYVSDSIVEAADFSASALLGTVFGGPVSFKNSAVENVKVNAIKGYAAIFAGMAVAQAVEITDCYVKDSSVESAAQSGLICGRVSGGSIAVHNLLAIVDIKATGNAESGSTASYAGLVYGTYGSDRPNVGAIEGFYHVSTVTAAVEALINTAIVDQTTAVELTQITGETAKTTLSGFDFENIWKTVENGTPIIELRGEALGGGDDDDDDDDFLSEGDGEGDGKDDGATNGNANTDTDTETDASQSDASTDGETKSGCGGMIGLASIAMIAVVSGAAIMLKKEK